MSEPAEDTYEEYVKHHDQLRKQLKNANALLSGACMLGLPTLDQKAYEAVKAMRLERDALTSRVAALERDAKRYRYLFDAELIFVGKWQSEAASYTGEGEFVLLLPEQLDTAIDSALALRAETEKIT